MLIISEESYERVQNAIEDIGYCCEVKDDFNQWEDIASSSIASFLDDLDEEQLEMTVGAFSEYIVETADEDMNMAMGIKAALARYLVERLEYFDTFVLKTAGWSRDKINSRISELLEFVKLTDKADTYPSKLSGGQKQRVAIARAIANNTNILLCDEPTSALDAETTASVLGLLKEVNEKLGVTIIIITHELDVVKEICDKVAVMSNGEVVEIGDVYSVFTNPQHEFTKQLIAHTQNFEIPEKIRDSINGPVIKLTYLGEKAAEAVLSQTAKDYNISYNILHGKIEYIGTKPIGILYVNITGDSSDIERSINALKERTYNTEVVISA